MSLATLDRRVPAIETVKTKWQARLIQVEELDRYLAERRQEERVSRRRPEPPARKSGLDPELVAHLRGEYAKGRTLAEIARPLNAGWRANIAGAVVSGGRRRHEPSWSALVRPMAPG